MQPLSSWVGRDSWLPEGWVQCSFHHTFWQRIILSQFHEISRLIPLQMKVFLHSSHWWKVSPATGLYTQWSCCLNSILLLVNASSLLRSHLRHQFGGGWAGRAQPSVKWDSADSSDTCIKPCSLSSQHLSCGSWNMSKKSLKLFLSNWLPHLLNQCWPCNRLWPREHGGLNPLECSPETSVLVRLEQTEKHCSNAGL